MYGLKKQNCDPLGALKAYNKSANKFQPEAMSNYAQIVYNTLLQPYGFFTLTHLPQYSLKFLDNSQVEKMWWFLENAALMNYISPFLVFQVEQAKDLKYWNISDVIKNAMNRRGQEFNIRENLQQYSSIRSLSSLNSEFEIIEHQSQREKKDISNLSSVRLESINNISISQLIEKANLAFEKKQYPNAIRFYTFAIDKLQSENPIEKMNRMEKLKMIKLLNQRANCNLMIAENTLSFDTTDLALDDHSFITNLGIFNEELVNSDKLVYESYKEIQATGKKLKKIMIEVLKSEKNKSRSRNRRANREKEYQKLRDKNNELIVDGTLCTKLAESNKGYAINASSNDDGCPICLTRWCDFIDPTIAGILPCNHAVCIECLAHEFKSCNDKSIPEKDRREFCCFLCRTKLSNDTLKLIAKSFINNNLINTIKECRFKLPFSKEEYDELVVSLLLENNKFDVCKVEFSLLNMISLIDTNPEKELSSDDKELFYQQAREPVKKLISQYNELRFSIDYLINTQSEEFRNKKKKLKELRSKIEIASKNAANDIFERINSKMDTNNINKIYCVDLHGLHNDENTREILKEHVLPILSVVKKIMIITGKGLHNQSGKSVLKQAVQEYLTTLNYKIENVIGNDGAFYVLNN